MTWHFMLNSINKEKQILNKDWLRFTKLLELPFLANWEPKLEPLMLDKPLPHFPSGLHSQRGCLGVRGRF